MLSGLFMPSSFLSGWSGNCLHLSGRERAFRSAWCTAGWSINGTVCSNQKSSKESRTIKICISNNSGGLWKEISEGERVQIAETAIGYTIDVGGFCSALSVFKVAERPARMTLGKKQLRRAGIVDHTMKELEKQTRRKVSFGLSHEGNMKRMKALEALWNPLAVSPVLVYWIVMKTSKTLFNFI